MNQGETRATTTVINPSIYMEANVSAVLREETGGEEARR